METIYSKKILRAIRESRDEALTLGHTAVEPEHLLLGLLSVPDSTAYSMLIDIGIDIEYSIVATNEDFSRELKDSFYIPDIRFRDMYNISVDFMNNQLLRSDFNTNDPLNGYDTGNYIFEATKIDNTHVEFSISDPESKLIDGGPFEIGVVCQC